VGGDKGRGLRDTDDGDVLLLVAGEFAGAVTETLVLT
jgi:hypothetical protein